MSSINLRQTALRQRRFLGRSGLVSQLVAALAAPGSNVLLAGAGGVGKTSLAVHSLEQFCAQNAGLQLVHFTATEATRRTPLAVFDSVLADDNQASAQRPDKIGAYIVQQCLQNAGGEKSKSASKPSRLIVHIDDVPLLDQMSEDVLAYLISRTDVRVVLTCRSNPGPSAMLVREWRDGMLERIEVPELSLPETNEFIAAILPAQPFAKETLERVHQMTGGNALFLQELLLALDASGQLETRQGLRVWTGQLPAATSLSDIVKADIAQLTAEQRSAFEIVALCAPVSMDLLGRQVSLDAMEMLSDAGLVSLSTATSTAGSVVSLAHPIFGEVMTGLLNPARIRRHYQELFQSAMERYAPESNRSHGSTPLVWTGETSELLIVVDWALGAGEEIPLPLLKEAFRYGKVLSDYAFRIRMATMILRHTQAPVELRIDALINRIEAYRFSNNPGAVTSDALRAKEVVEELPEGKERNDLAVDLAVVVADAFVLTQGRWEEGLEVLAWAESLIQLSEVSSRQALHRLAASRGIYLGYGGKMQESFEVQQRIYSATRSTSDFLPLASTRLITLGQRGEAKQARSLGRTQVTYAVRSMTKYPLAVGEIVAAWCLSDMLTGNIREASFMYGLMNAAAARNPGHVQMRKTLLAFGRGLLASMNGEWALAAENLTMACAELEDFTGTGSEGLLLATLALSHAGNGDYAASAQVRQQLLNRATGESRLLELPSRYSLLLASMYSPTGGEEAEALELIDLAQEFTFGLMELRALHLLACCAPNGLSSGQLERARFLSSSMDAPIAAPLMASCEHITKGGVASRGDAARLLARRGLLVPAAPIHNLTAREQQLAGLLALGYSNNQITKKLVISKRTTEAHTAKIFHKLNVKSRDDIAEALDALEQVGM